MSPELSRVLDLIPKLQPNELNLAQQAVKDVFRSTKNHYRVGDRIQWFHSKQPGRWIEAVVERVNEKSVSIRNIEDNVRWRVPPECTRPSAAAHA